MKLTLSPESLPDIALGQQGLTVAIGPTAFGEGITTPTAQTQALLSPYVTEQGYVLTAEITTISLSQDAAVLEVVSQETVFSQATSLESLRPGQFHFDSLIRVLSVRRPAGESTPSVLVTTLRPSSTISPTTEIVELGIDPILQKWPPLATREAIIPQIDAFETQPSLAIPFRIYSNRLDEFLADFKGGTEYAIFGRRWVVNNVSVEMDADQSAINTTQLRVAFQGPWASRAGTIRNALDRPQRLRQAGSSVPANFDRDRPPTAVAVAINSSNRRFRTTVATICARAGVLFSGAAPLIEIPTETSSETYITAREAVIGGDRARVFGGFVYWSNSSRVEYRNWFDQPIVGVFYVDSSTPRNFILSGQGAVVDGTQLTYELVNAIGSLDNTGLDGGRDLEGVRIVRQFKGTDSAFDLGIPPTGTVPDDLRTNQNWDSGGPIKEDITTAYVNGVETFQDRQIYGFAYSSADVHNVNLNDNQLEITFDATINPTTFWGLRSTVVTPTNFNNDGYLVRRSTSGNRQVRLLQESGIEAAEIQGQLLRATPGSEQAARLTAILEAYQYNISLPASRITNFILEDLRDYFDDLQEPNGEAEDFVPPFYAKRVTERENTEYIERDPRETSTNVLPPLVKRFFDQTTVTTTVVSTDPPAYVTEIETLSIKNQSGQDRAKIESADTVLDRPPIQERLDLTTNRYDPGRGQDDDLVQYILNTEGSNPPLNIFGQGNPANLTFAGATTANRLQSAARTEAAIANTLRAEARTFTFRFYPYQLEVGQRISWDGKIWRVLRIQINRRAQKRGFIYESVIVDTARDVAPSVSITRRDRKTGTTVSAL